MQAVAIIALSMLLNNNLLMSDCDVCTKHDKQQAVVLALGVLIASSSTRATNGSSTVAFASGR